MKKFFLLFAAVVLTAFSADVFAQGTGVAPGIGEVHTYSVTAHIGNSFAWSVTTNADGTGAVASSIATLSSAGGLNVNSIDITWVNPSIGTTYYVHVIETDATGCSNRKAISVLPANNFELQIENVSLADAVLAQDFAICPATVTVTEYTGINDGTIEDARKFTYDYHRDSVYYKVTASGINLSNTTWSPQFTIDHDTITGTTVTAGWSESLTGSFTTLNVDDTANDIIVPTSANGVIYIKVVVDNADNLTGNEGLTANDILVTLLNTANTSEDGNGNDVTGIGNGSRNQIIKVRPATSDIITTD